jgi:hypothetical protein
MTPYKEQKAAIVRAFEIERDDILKNSNGLERLANLTVAECEILAHAAIRSLGAAGYEIVPRKHATRL